MSSAMGLVIARQLALQRGKTEQDALRDGLVGFVAGPVPGVLVAQLTGGAPTVRPPNGSKAIGGGASGTAGGAGGTAGGDTGRRTDWDGLVAFLLAEFDKLIDELPEKLREFVERRTEGGTSVPAIAATATEAGTSVRAAAPQAPPATTAPDGWNEVVAWLKSEARTRTVELLHEIQSRIAEIKRQEERAHKEEAQEEEEVRQAQEEAARREAAQQEEARQKRERQQAQETGS
jgi:hypothetical protein